MRPSPRRRIPLLPLGAALAAATAATACGGAGADGAPAAATPPARAGEVWALDGVADRATAPGALAAYVHGLHVVVLDGDAAYAGTTRLTATTAADGTRRYRLADGSEAELEPAAGDSMLVRFADGAQVALRRRADSEGR